MVGSALVITAWQFGKSLESVVLAPAPTLAERCNTGWKLLDVATAQAARG